MAKINKNRKIYPVQQGKTSFKRIILENVRELQKEVLSIKKDIKKEAEKVIEKEIKSRLALVDFSLREIRLFCDILIEKGIATQEEISQGRKKLKEEAESKK